jgi:demethylmenaquinone methyltransferase/2-methoxy-6-polyprenyl-1,4-benzoquinol methylase
VHEDDGLTAYYARRVHDYERVYAKPERQGDLAALRAVVADWLAGQDVLEIACGTGSWTEVISRAARSILATDTGDDVLALARRKRYIRRNVRFAKADAFALNGLSGVFTAAFAGFWWSHIPIRRVSVFLAALRARLQPSALVVLADNRYVKGSNTPVSRIDTQGNTYQIRTLADGRTCEILKNFPDERALRSAAGGFGADVRYTNLTYFWCLSFRIAASGPVGRGSPHGGSMGEDQHEGPSPRCSRTP